MKTKTSITLSPDILSAIDAEVGPGGNRSQFIEDTMKRYFRQKRREERDRRDGEAYARHLATMSPEEEALRAAYLEAQVDPFELGDEVEVLIDEAPLAHAG